MIAIDNSTLAAVACCSTQAVLRYHLGLTAFEDRAPMRAGSAAHAALAAWFQKGTEAALEVLEAEYTLWALENVPEGDRLSPPNVIRTMRQYFESHPPGSLPFVVEPGFVECGFAVPLDEDGEFVFVGRLDALARDHNNAYWIVEHKTTGRLDDRWRRRFQSAAQVTGYVWAAQQHTERPVVGAFINGIELSKLPSDEKRKCRDHGVVYAECGAQHARTEMLIELRSPHELEEWRKTALHLARKFRDLCRMVPTLADLHKVRMQGQFTGACSDCQFNDFCRRGRPIAAANAMLRLEPWSPWDHTIVGHGT